jgi:hypothetical protein
MLLASGQWIRLEYLHDAKVLSVLWDSADPGQRRLILDVVCDPDSEDDEWRNRQLQIILSDAVAVLFRAWGHSVGDEVLDSWRNEVSTEMRNRLKELSQSGIAVPDAQFTIAFASGSTLQVVCREVSVEDIGPGNEKL